MHERRQEPFRYSFQTPLPGFYNKKLNRHVSGLIEVKDISMNGLRFSCDSHPGLSTKDEIFISFMYEKETFTTEGRIIWLKTEHESMTCGVHVFDYPIRLKEILQELGESLNKKDQERCGSHHS
ncbi:PilZ domain-containing protein [Halobacillus litoralis]|uniref:PilZ domain-containing protein n=1 Tax=Halobacillus litoralis TaxID=45668 RepID=UPI001CFC5303|nr:PilZ domain-containing protein [Halobacillus litoralis]